MKLFDELQARGLIAQTTHEDEIREVLEKEKVTFYIGFDPTADSLHIGHFLQLIIMKRFQMAGHRPIALLGGGTTMVGDPSGRTDMRSMMTQEIIQKNADCFKKQMSTMLDFSEGKALMLNNADWLLNLNYVEFLRNVGVHFSVNRMLTAECFKSRMEAGLSFLEFNYMLMQSYDFLVLFREHGCSMQLGGNDQWSNIIAGADLIRRVEQKPAFGMTFTLLTTSEGIKMGKTQRGAVWLDPNKTSPYDFFQYWRNVADADVIRCMKLLTFVPLEEIAEMEALEGSALNAVKERLAVEITTMVHGAEEAQKAKAASAGLFSDGGSLDHVPTTELEAGDFEAGAIGIIALLTKSGLAPSNGEARRLIQQGGILVDEQKVDDFGKTFTESEVAAGLLIKKGKKTFHRVVCK